MANLFRKIGFKSWMDSWTDSWMDKHLYKNARKHPDNALLKQVPCGEFFVDPPIKHNFTFLTNR